MDPKIPFIKILYFYIKSGLAYNDTVSILESSFGYKIPADMFSSIKDYYDKNSAKINSSIENITSEMVETAMLIRGGFGSITVSDELLYLSTSPAFDFDSMSQIMLEAHYIDLKGMEPIFNLVFNYDGWNLIDWGRYITFLRNDEQNELADKVMLARFDNREYLLSIMGLTEGNSKHKVELIAKRYERVIHRLLQEEDAHKSLDLTETYAKLMKVMSSFNEDKGGSILNEILDKISLSRKDDYGSLKSITDDEFDGIEDSMSSINPEEEVN